MQTRIVKADVLVFISETLFFSGFFWLLAAGPIVNIINSSIDLCKYPASWKMGQVTPLFKKADELNKAN